MTSEHAHLDDLIKALRFKMVIIDTQKPNEKESTKVAKLFVAIEDAGIVSLKQWALRRAGVKSKVRP